MAAEILFVIAALIAVSALTALLARELRGGDEGIHVVDADDPRLRVADLERQVAELRQARARRRHVLRRH